MKEFTGIIIFGIFLAGAVSALVGYIGLSIDILRYLRENVNVSLGIFTSGIMDIFLAIALMKIHKEIWEESK